MSTYTFHVNGMHCNSCVLFLENELGGLPEISRVKVSLAKAQVAITGDFGGKEPERIAQELSRTVATRGYSLSVEKKERAVRWSDFGTAIPIAAAFITAFIVIQKLGIVNLITSSHVGYGTAFVVGLIASVSSCMAVVGGLVLSMSANFAKEGDTVRPQVLFHVGRLVSFFVLGGAIGLLGAAFQLGPTGTLVLNLAVAFVLMVLGINLLDIFSWAKRFQPTMPSFIGARIQSLRYANHTLTPLFVGVATFFLPCGFTQSMQIYSLTTGSFMAGALTMATFALGTLPMLSVLSFSSLAITSKAWSGIFFKTAGLVVIFFGIFNLINALAGAGLIPPLFSF